jgi:hypothetical protein
MRCQRRLLLRLLAVAAGGCALERAAAADPPTLLSIHGLVRHSAGEPAVHFTLPALERLPQQRIKTATPWHVGEPEFSGPLLRDVLAAAGARGTTLRMRALNDYQVDIPVEDTRQYDLVLAHRIDGQLIGVRDKGPLFLMYPFDRHPELRNSVYLSRCIWQLRRIECR